MIKMTLFTLLSYLCNSLTDIVQINMKERNTTLKPRIELSSILEINQQLKIKPKAI